MHRNLSAKLRILPSSTLLRFAAIFCCVLITLGLQAQQPAEPSDVSPIDGQVYYMINQLSGLQADLNNGSTTAGDSILINDRSFTSLSQRWAMTALPGGLWAISNLQNGLCLDSSTTGGTANVVQNPCSPASATQQWSFSAAEDGYVTVTNHGTGLVLDVSGGANTAGARLDETVLSSSASQSQQWLLRPVFFRGIDNALLEKQEAERVSENLPWWQDAGQTADVLQILKNHGVNMVRVRPTSEPPYNSYTSTSCSGNGCYAETDSQDINLAKRAKQLGMSVELTLFFDGGSSQSVPGDWSSDSLTQAETDVYNYVKSEVEAYRMAGAMPDMVTIGNEVDTGFFGTLASPSGSNFGPFAAIEKQAMQAVLDASSDTTIGPPLPPPIRCIHITPAWDLTSFFTDVNNAGIPYDAMCQSYYPMFHGPLTPAQAAASNPNHQPVEETALINAANNIGKPIFIIETAEHYENGFDSNDPWYPATRDGQRQFLIDLDGVLKQLPNHLGMGFEYWDPAGVDIPRSSGSGYVNGDGTVDAIFTWNGLTLFDNADTSGSTNTSASNYSALLPAVDALGGRLDQTLAYKLVNAATGQVLETAGVAGPSGIPLSTAADTGAETLSQQWTITSNGDGTFQIANRNAPSGSAPEVLDNGGSGTAGTAVVVKTASSSSSQAWDVLSAGGGTYVIMNPASGMVLTASGGIVQQAPAAANSDWVTPASSSQQWRIAAVHITAISTAAALSFDSSTPSTLTYGASLGNIQVTLVDNSGSLVQSSGQNVTLTIHGPGTYSYATSSTADSGVADFDLSNLVPPAVGQYTLTASSSGLTPSTITLNILPATLTVTANNASRIYGDANPSFTYNVTGFVNGDSSSVVTGTPSISTTATPSSDPGSYSINIAAGSLAAANYTFVFVHGTLTITPAPTATTLTTSASHATSGQAVTLTATVTSPSGIAPSGSVSFISGSTTLGSGTLNAAGIATLTTSNLQPGNDSIQAVYAGNNDFSASTSNTVTITESGFSISSGQSSVTLPAGGSSSISLTITPNGSYSGTIAMNCSSTLADVSCSLTPQTYTADGSDQSLTGTLTLTAASTTASNIPFSTGGRTMLLAAILFFPALLPTSTRRRRLYRSFAFAILLVPIMFSLTACGGNSSGHAPSMQQTGTVTVQATGSSGNVVQTLTINVTVQ